VYEIDQSGGYVNAGWRTVFADAPLPALNTLDRVAIGLQYWIFVDGDGWLRVAR
jgi:hypothetical protein